MHSDLINYNNMYNVAQISVSILFIFSPNKEGRACLFFFLGVMKRLLYFSKCLFYFSKCLSRLTRRRRRRRRRRFVPK